MGFPDRESIIWAAGLFEGEGCIRVRKKGHEIVLGMTDQDVVERFARIVRCGTVTQEDRNPRHKDLWLWRATNYEHVQAVLAMFWPFLGERRRARASEALSRLPKKPGSPKWSHCLRGHPLTEANTIHKPRGKGRQCRICRNARKRERYKLRKEAV